MDPGPWSPYTYNGLSASGVASAPGTFATAAGQRAVADFQAMGSQPGASQLLLAGMSPAAVAAAANSASFLSSNYEPVFSSLFHHTAQKSQYGALNVAAAHHRQSLVKPGDNELTAALRDNYMHQSVATSTAAALYEQTSPLNWSQAAAANNSLGSPFGVLPHESVSGSSKSSSSDGKKGHIFTEGSPVPYENTFSAHLSPPFAHGYTNSQLSAAAADFRNSTNSVNYENSKKVQKSTSHDSKPTTTSASWQGAFSQVTPTSTRECASLPPPPSATFAPSHAQKVQAVANFASRAAAAAIASSVSNAHQQQPSQSCIVSRPSHHQVPPNLPFVPQHRPSSVPAPIMQEKTAPRTIGFNPKSNTTISHIPTKAQTKIFSSGPLDASVNSSVSHESSQSSPRYGLDANHNFSSSSAIAAAVAAAAVAASSKPPNIPQAHQRTFPPPVAAHMNQFRSYPSPDAPAPSGPVSHASEYQRSTPDSIALSPYSDSEPQHCHTQNGGSSSSSGLGRPSPTQTSPLSHTPSPAYPIYNSPMSAPSPLHEAQSCVYSKPTASSQQPSAYSSVIQCNSTPSEVKQIAHNRQNFAHSMKQNWEMQEKLARGVRDMSSHSNSTSRFPYAGSESMDVMDDGLLAGNANVSEQRQSMYDHASTINMQDLAGPSNEELLARAEADADEYDRRRGRKIKRRKSGDKGVKQAQNCGYPPLQNGYFPAYHENFMARNAPLGGYHPRLGFNPAHMHGQPAPAHSQCPPNAMYQMGPLHLSMQQQGPCTSSSLTPPHPEKPPLAGPSVDEELGFLEDPSQTVTAPTATTTMAKPGSSKDSTGFMDSYLKFLRGETETPLTVNVRAGRKSPKVADPLRKINTSNIKIGTTSTATARSQMAKAVQSQPQMTTTIQNSNKPCHTFQQTASNSGMTQQQIATNSTNTTQTLNTCDSVKRVNSDHSVVLENQVRQQLPSEMTSCLMEEKKAPKDVSLEPSVHIDPDIRARVEARARESYSGSMSTMHRGRGRPKRSVSSSEDVEEAPTRKTARRKAKEAIERNKLTELSDDEEPKYPDSDSDPAWTPPLAEGNGGNKSWLSKRDTPRKRGRQSQYSKDSSDEESMIGQRITVSSGSETDSKSKKPHRRRYSQVVEPVKTVEVHTQSVQTTTKSVATVPVVVSKPVLERQIPPPKNMPPEEYQKQFVSGAFIIPKSDVDLERPNIWRIDGRNLIQKFEPYEDEGKTLYKNVSTYSGWTPDSFRSYELADVTFIKNTRQETIIQLTQNDAKQKEDALKRRFMLESQVYETPFRTYMQTLVSQVLDNTFLSVIIGENDEYFVTNLQRVDGVIEKKRQQLRKLLNLENNTEELVRLWPAYSTVPVTSQRGTCVSCNSEVATLRVILMGDPYDNTTLSLTDQQLLPSQREFYACKKCEDQVEIYSKLVHLKLNYYKMSAVKVQEAQANDPNMETSDLLQYVLNTDWIDKLFRGLQEFWAEIDLMIHNSMSNGATKH